MSDSTTTHPIDDKVANHATLDTKLVLDELLKERRRDRRAGYVRTGLIVGAGLLYAGLSAIFIGSPFKNSAPNMSEPFAAVVSINGPIGAGNSASFEAVAPLLKEAFAHPNAKGVVLRINSPGGTPVQSSLIHDLILELKDKHEKPVVAVGEDMLTSGAYFIAVAADKIIANKSTVTGSIGVISSGFGFQGVMEKVGVERRVNTAGNSKSMGDPFLAETPEEKVVRAELLSDIHEHFKEAVREGRGDRLQLDTPGLFEGKVWTGGRAVTLGLVDELGDINSAAQNHLGTDVTIGFNSKKPLMATLLDSVGLMAQNLINTSAATAPQLLPK